MKKFLCIVGCIILAGSSLTYATSNENRTPLFFNKTTDMDLSALKDNYQKQKEGDEIFGTDVIYFHLESKDGRDLGEFKYAYTKDDEAIPSEVFDAGDRDTGRAIRLMYDGVIYERGQAFIKSSMVDRDINVKVLDRVDISDKVSVWAQNGGTDADGDSDTSGGLYLKADLRGITGFTKAYVTFGINYQGLSDKYIYQLDLDFNGVKKIDGRSGTITMELQPNRYNSWHIQWGTAHYSAISGGKHRDYARTAFIYNDNTSVWIVSAYME